MTRLELAVTASDLTRFQRGSGTVLVIPGWNVPEGSVPSERGTIVLVTEGMLTGFPYSIRSVDRFDRLGSYEPREGWRTIANVPRTTWNVLANPRNSYDREAASDAARPLLPADRMESPGYVLTIAPEGW